MRIACPSCNAAYQVPDEQVTAGRVVRCARCGAEWTPFVAVPPDEPVAPPPEPERPSEPPPEPVPAPLPEPPRMVLDEPSPSPPVQPPPPPARRFPALAAAWVVSLAVVAGALATLAVRHEEVMRLWPPSARAFVALGLASRP